MPGNEQRRRGSRDFAGQELNEAALAHVHAQDVIVDSDVLDVSAAGLINHDPLVKLRA